MYGNTSSVDAAIAASLDNFRFNERRHDSDLRPSVPSQLPSLEFKYPQPRLIYTPGLLEFASPESPLLLQNFINTKWLTDYGYVGVSTMQDILTIDVGSDLPVFIVYYKIPRTVRIFSRASFQIPETEICTQLQTTWSFGV